MLTPAYAMNLFAKTMDNWFPAAVRAAPQPLKPPAGLRIEADAPWALKDKAQHDNTKIIPVSKYASWPWP